MNRKGVFMNDIIQAMINRRSIRKYKTDMLPQSVIDEIINAGLYAASGMGKQNTIILAITNKEIRDKLAKINAKIAGWGENTDPFYGAPVVLVVLADKNWFTGVYDGSLVIGNLMLAADSLNVGSCWIHRAKEEFEMPEYKELLKSLGIEGEWEGVGHCILGYPAEVITNIPKRKDNRVFYVK